MISKKTPVASESLTQCEKAPVSSRRTISVEKVRDAVAASCEPVLDYPAVSGQSIGPVLNAIRELDLRKHGANRHRRSTGVRC
jgi:hypothetical protein